MSIPVSKTPYLPNPPRDPSGVLRWAQYLNAALYELFTRLNTKVNSALQSDGSVPLDGLTVAELLALPATAGSIRFLTDGTMPLAVGDGTDWLYPDGSIVT
jgi:hypothetical protein